jgi:CubicO group peptidase (beta-lactamase class C family)
MERERTHGWRSRLGSVQGHLLRSARAVAVVVPAAASFDAQQLDQMYAFADELVQRGRTPGLCIAVSRYGQQLTRVFGHSGPDEGQLNQGLTGGMVLQNDSIFAVASITKPITAAAALVLIDKHMLDLDARVARLLPEFSGSHNATDPRKILRTSRSRAWREEMTVRHLLTHTSGLPDSWPGSHPLRRRRAPLADYTREELGLDLLFAPGTNVSCGS